MGETIQIKQYQYTLPDKPSRKEIHGYDKAPTDQCWQRIEEPDCVKIKNPTPAQQAAKEKWIDKMVEYRINGYWFWNYNPRTKKSEPCYITGDNFFFLNFIKIDGAFYPEFRMAQRDYHYFLDLCDNDPLCHGDIKGKYRREGATTMVIAKMVNRATLVEHGNFGMQSKTDVDAKNIDFKAFVDMVYDLPHYFKPIMASNERPKTYMEFRRPPMRYTKSLIKKMALWGELEQTEDGLDNYIDYRATTKEAYDGHKMVEYLMDEFSKWKNANPMETFRVVKKSLSLGGGRIVYGKFHILTTSDEDDSPAFMQWRLIWEQSDPNKRGEDGKTVSGVYRYFIAAFEGLEGFIDKYGYCDEEAAKKYLMSVRAKLKEAGDDRGLLVEIRQMPFDEQEMLDIANSSSTFSVNTIMRISQRVREIELMPERDYEKGNFEWSGGHRDSSVIWTASDKGKWLIGKRFHPQGSDRNRIKRLPGNKFAPHPDTTYCGSLDPIDFDETVSGKGSLAGSHISQCFDYADDALSDSVCSEYLARPDDTNILYEDMIKQCFYFGAKFLPERKSYGVFKYFKDRGYEAFLMIKPPMKGNKAQQKEKALAGVPAHKDVTLAGVELIESYFSKPRNFDEPDKLARFIFPRTLVDIINLNPNDTRKSDLTMSFIYLMFAKGEMRKKTMFGDNSMGRAVAKLFGRR